MPLFRTVFDTKGFFFFIPNGFYPERYFRIFGEKTFRNKNLSEKQPFKQKPFGIKTFRRNDTSKYRPAPEKLFIDAF